MMLYGAGRAAIIDDREAAERLGWTVRPRSAGDAEILLRRRDGDPTREPWIAPGWWAAGPGAETLWRGRVGGGEWSYLLTEGALRDIRALAAPRRGGAARVAIAGLGRVGGTAAATLATMPTAESGIGELLLDDGDATNAERWLLELEAIAEWRSRRRRPRVRRVGPDDVFRECDVFVFAAAAGVPPLGVEGDVRHVQLGANRTILARYLEAAARSSFSGLFLVVSDPVETLAQSAFHDSNVDPSGRFTGLGLAPERVAGMALGVMWARAVAAARKHGWETEVERRGGAYGPHTTEVVVFDDLRSPDDTRSAVLTMAAREGNYELRRVGYLPHVGPALSSVALALPRLLSGRECLASSLVDGVYFGGPVRRDWGIYPVSRVMGSGARRVVAELHALVGRRVASSGLAFDPRPMVTASKR